MPARPLISILTPVYNFGSFIEETIHSVMNQTYKDWEWIIFDDGSTDNTGDIIKGIKDSRITYIFQEHMGIAHLARSFNKALSLCNGSLIAMLDGDDYWPDYKLEVQVKDFDSSDIVLSYGESIAVGKSGKKVHYMMLPPDPHVANNSPIGSSLRLFLLQRINFITNPTVMINKKALLRIGGFVEAKGLWQDFPTWTRIALEGRFAAHPLCLGYWRWHPSSTSYTTNPETVSNAATDFLRDFFLLHREKLAECGFFYDVKMLEEHWKNLNPYARYNFRALVALSLGSFKEAEAAFKKFLEKDPSLRQKLIFCLVILSSLIHYDLVNPLVTLKARLDKIMQVHCAGSSGYQ